MKHVGPRLKYGIKSAAAGSPNFGVISVCLYVDFLHCLNRWDEYRDVVQVGDWNAIDQVIVHVRWPARNRDIRNTALVRELGVPRHCARIHHVVVQPLENVWVTVHRRQVFQLSRVEQFLGE